MLGNFGNACVIGLALREIHEGRECFRCPSPDGLDVLEGLLVEVVSLCVVAFIPGNKVFVLGFPLLDVLRRQAHGGTILAHACVLECLENDIAEKFIEGDLLGVLYLELLVEFGTHPRLTHS